MTTRGEHSIGDWRFDVAGATLIGPAGERRLEDRSARTLAMLCRRRGETVSSAEILQEVWQGRAVSPNSVAVVVGDLRRSLGDDARDPAHIVTVAKRGYRLNTAASNAPAAPRRVERFTRPGALRLAVGGLAVLGLIALAAFGTALAPASRPVLMMVEPVANETARPDYDALTLALSELVTNRMAQQADIRVVPAPSTASAPRSGRSIRLVSRLILWNGQPTLSMTATDARSGTVIWAGMASGPAEALAGATIEKVQALGARARAL